MKIVKPKKFSGMNMSWNLNMFSGPKFYIECGDCGRPYNSRVPVQNYPKTVCPYCKTINQLPLVIE